MRALHLFAGAGGSVLAGRLLGWESAGAVELDPYCCAVLEARGERVLARDITAFDARPLRGLVDVVVGGWPCQDLSVAGKRAGLEGERSGLFWQMMRVVDECQPRFVFGENVAGLLSSNGGRDFAAVLGALAARGYDARWQVLGARAVGAPHRRERVWIVGHATTCGRARGVSQREPVFEPFQTGADLAYAPCDGREQGWAGTGERAWPGGQSSGCGAVAHSGGSGLEVRRGMGPRGEQQCWPHTPAAAHHGGTPEPGMGGEPYGLANGLDWPASRGSWPAGRGAAQHAWEAPRTVTERVPARVPRLKALGNGWVPQCAAAAWRLLCDG